tara:strand:+ start:600 stop:2318 length:1719 start_codon:yes stop_codon:yes gene_type:complete
MQIIQQKEKYSTRKDFLHLFKESELNNGSIFAMVSLTILLGISEFFFISLIAIFTNAIINGKIPKNLLLDNDFLSNIFENSSSILILLIISFVIRSFLVSFKNFYISRLNGKIRKVFRIKILSNFLNNTRKSGIYSGKIFDMYFQSSAVASKVIINFFDLVINILFTFSALYVLFVNFSYDLLFAILIIGIAYFFFLKFIKKYSSILSKKNQEINQDISQRTSEILKGYREIQIYGIKSKTISKIEAVENDAIDNISKSVFLNGIPSLLPAFLLVCVIIYASFISDNFQFSEQAPNIIIIVIFLQRCGNFLGIIGSKLTTIILAKAHVKHLLSGIKLKKSREIKTNKLVLRKIKSISLEKINFSYSEEVIFKDSSIDITPSKINLILGKSGTGKSTLFSILLKENDVNSGNIFINEYNLNTISEIDLYKNISLIPQDPYIFSASIFENISIAKIGASAKEVINATKFSGAYDFIKKLPNSLDTKLSEGGINLSGGQRQLISISRAFLRNSQIILLDEPTNNLDEEGIQKLKKILEKWKEMKKIVLISTHDNRIKNNDYQIFEIKNKKINKYL